MTTATTSPTLPGRLGNPDLRLNTDPRADPRMVAELAIAGLDGASTPLPVTVNSTLEERLAFTAAAESTYEQVFVRLCAGLPPVEGVSSRTETTTGPEGGNVSLYIHTPTAMPAPLPCIFHIHGGGMAILKASDPMYVRWRDELAAAGLVVVGVEFRNAAGALGNHPFPAGLDDCATGLAWVSEHARDLGISKLVVSGESGGGNLSLATAIRAVREGTIDRVAGVYALCPYISSAWAVKRPDLPSLYENDDYFIACDLMGVLASIYDPSGTHATDPLCWPLHASRDDLQGLPPHVISVNELDPLRDEGLAYYRMLATAGVDVVSRSVNGTCHAGDVLLRRALPEVYAATIHDIKGFADRL